MHAIAQLNSAILSWSHGIKGLVLVYGMIAVFLLVGLVRGEASVTGRGVPIFAWSACWPAACGSRSRPDRRTWCLTGISVPLRPSTVSERVGF